MGNAEQIFRHGDYGHPSEEMYKDQKRELEESLTIAKGKLEQIDSEINDYNRQAENAFTFCRYALYALKNADLQTRKSILISLGSNHKVIDKNLYLDTFGWLSEIKKGEDLVAAPNVRFELERDINDNGFLGNSQNFLSVCPTRVSNEVISSSVSVSWENINGQTDPCAWGSVFTKCNRM